MPDAEDLKIMKDVLDELEEENNTLALGIAEGFARAQREINSDTAAESKVDDQSKAQELFNKIQGLN